MASSVPAAARKLHAVSLMALTPNMLRVTLGGNGIATFPAAQEGGYVKLMFPPQLGSSKRPVRTYTIRNQRTDAIDIDFALHGVGSESVGPATQWAMSVKPGAAIMVGGPGPAKPLPMGADWYIIAGDVTALPAISVNLEKLSRDARGLAVIEIQDESDRQTIDAPCGIEIHWMVNPAPGTKPLLLADKLRNSGWPDGRVYGWAASEFSAMRALRAYLRDERGLSPTDLYISSYWKAGLPEEGHKIAKREDAVEATR